jgi:adenylosuccinate synthase
MEEKKIFTITDLGGGDGGKGGVVHKVCTIKNAHTVLKVGGAQGSHGVRTSRGESFNFSQFGCGTFEGIRTHITDRMVIEPIGLMKEGNSLRLEHGVPNAFDLLTVDENCLCSVPFHGIASRLRELARKENQKGTVGVGIGEAKSDAERFPELAIYAKDIAKDDIGDKIEAIRSQKIAELAPIIENIGDLWLYDQDAARKEKTLLQDPRFVQWIIERFKRFVSQVSIVGREYLTNKILSRDGVVVVESSHGILTDKYYGFHPYTSRLRTVPFGTLDLLRECEYAGDIVRLGVTRAYQIRHGAGPLVTESKELVKALLPGSSKNNNRYQGEVRVGPLDLVALRYSIDVCGGPSAFDGLAVTWFDQIQKVGVWQTCDRYKGTDDSTLFENNSRIHVRHGSDDHQIEHQQRLAKALFSCKPTITSRNLLPTETEEGLINLCTSTLSDKLRVPVRMISFGQTENDKVCL